jgi:hypothetical protein
MAWLKLHYINQIKKRGSFNKGRGRVAWCCFLGEGGRGSFVSVLWEQEDYEN